MARAKEILIAKLTEPPTRDDLGREIGISSYYLSRTFSQETGMTIPQFLRRTRIYSHQFASDAPVTLSLDIPTNGTVGTGFTTIIVQGRTIFGGYPSPLSDPSFSFPTLAGDTPDLVVGTNNAGQGQFWVKYEIAGNAATYDLDFDLIRNDVSVATLVVDTHWSASGFAPDAAQAVPEPTAALTLLGSAGLLGMLRRRRA